MIAWKTLVVGFYNDWEQFSREHFFIVIPSFSVTEGDRIILQRSCFYRWCELTRRCWFARVKVELPEGRADFLGGRFAGGKHKFAREIDFIVEAKLFYQRLWVASEFSKLHMWVDFGLYRRAKLIQWGQIASKKWRSCLQKSKLLEEVKKLLVVVLYSVFAVNHVLIRLLTSFNYFSKSNLGKWVN